jgi:hypothetical protein
MPGQDEYRIFGTRADTHKCMMNPVAYRGVECRGSPSVILVPINLRLRISKRRLSSNAQLWSEGSAEIPLQEQQRFSLEP